jgi:hypothetical protein
MTFTNKNLWNKTHEFRRWKIKDDNSRTKKAIPSKIEEGSKLQTPYREEPFCEYASKGSEKAREWWKNLRWELSIYRGEGVVQETASIWLLRVLRKTRVHSDVLRVTFFTRIQKFSWKQIVGVNPLPRGASVGEFGKNVTPSKRRVCRDSRNKFLSNVQKWQPNMASSRESAVHFRMIVNLQSFESWVREDLESWTCEAPESGICEIREFNEAQIRRL